MEAANALERELLSRQLAVRDSRGWALRREILAVDRTDQVFHGNDRELSVYLAAQAAPERALELWKVGSPEFEPFLDEVDRLLHNYLSAVASLRDHQRRLWKKKHPPDDPVVAAEYDIQRATAFADPVCAFVQDLRNYTLHRQLPVAQGQLHVDVQGDVFDAGVTLVRDQLLEGVRWSTDAKKYLSAAPDAIRLRETVASYTDAVEQFYRWFAPAFVTAHRVDFDELEALEQDIERLYSSAT